MHYSWWVVALVALVVAGGAVVGLWRSKSAVESRAVALSLAMLALVALVFFFLTVIEIPVLPIVFAVACVVAPLATYVVVVIVHSAETSCRAGLGEETSCEQEHACGEVLQRCPRRFRARLSQNTRSSESPYTRSAENPS